MPTTDPQYPPTDEPTAPRCAWDPRARERNDAWRAMLRQSRALRTIGALSIPQPTEPTSAAGQASESQRKRAARLEAADVARRDAIERADCYPLTGQALMERAAAAVQRSAPRANDDEQNDAVAYALFRVIQRHGPAPLSADVAPRWLERLTSGRILNERQRAARHVVPPDDDDGQDRDDEQSERDHVTRSNVWAAFSVDPLRPERARSVEVSADDLADALQAVTQRAVQSAARFSIGAALNGYGSGLELAGALGISAGAARKRLHDGREQLRRIAPTAGALTDALVDALAMLDDEPAPTDRALTLPAAAHRRLRLRMDARRALRTIDAARATSYRLAATTATGNGACPTRDPLPTAPLARWHLTRGAVPLAAAVAAAGYPVPLALLLVHPSPDCATVAPTVARDWQRDDALTSAAIAQRAAWQPQPTAAQRSRRGNGPSRVDAAPYPSRRYYAARAAGIRLRMEG